MQCFSHSTVESHGLLDVASDVTGMPRQSSYYRGRTGIQVRGTHPWESGRDVASGGDAVRSRNYTV